MAFIIISYRLSKDDRPLLLYFSSALFVVVHRNGLKQPYNPLVITP